MTALRLLADDLTGALDTAAEFVSLTGPVDAFWHGMALEGLPANVAMDSGTREAGLEEACTAVRAATPMLASGGIAFKKIDSLIRGHTLAELVTCFTAGRWKRCVLAPAFPFQGRVTRGAQQWAASVEGWSAVGPDLLLALRTLGVQAHQPGGALRPGITVFDAETDADLRAAVAVVGGRGAPVLWCGTGGLAMALAGNEPASLPELPRPILGMFGTDQKTTFTQLAACGAHWHVLDAGAEHAAALARALERDGVALVSHILPPGLSRADATSRIDSAFASLVGALPAPGTLVVAGGETLRSLCLRLGATSLQVRGRLVPGVPVSMLCGGVWDGITVVSKSGAFGQPDLLRDLLALERTSA